MKLWSTLVAAFQFVLPACDARTMTAPAPVRVRTFPVRLAGPEITLKLTTRLEEALALRVMGASPYVLFASAAKEMLWLPLATVKVWSTLVAAFQFASPGCNALTMTMPAPVRVRTFPLRLAGPETRLKVTTSPE